MAVEEGRSAGSHLVAIPFIDPILSVVGISEMQLLKYMAYFMIFRGAIVIVLLQRLNAPYGRYANTTWGFGISARFAWFVQELPSFLVPILLVFFTECQQMPKLPNVLLISMMIIHYFQRTFIFSLLIRGGTPTPVVPFLMASTFCTYNGYMQGRYLTEYAVYSDEWIQDPRFLIGICVFVSGMVINIHSDYILRNLRKPGETGYKIPRGGLFDYVSGANFLGEITEWVGYAIACWNIPACAFAFFTLCNIGPRAYHHHKYYLQKFDDYPRERKVLIPFIL